MQEIEKLIQGTVHKQFGKRPDVELTRTEGQFGDYATNVALRLTKELAQSPREIAKQIVDNLDIKTSPIESAAVADPGFINLTLRSSWLARNLLDVQEAAPQKVYGANATGEGVVVLCEFPSPNTAKPFSVGHIRAALQGWSIAQLMRLTGHTVITDNHLGDAGTPFGKWVVGYLTYSSKEKLAKGGIDELARIYIVITADMKQEKESGGHTLSDQVQTWLQKLESGDEEATAYSEQFNKISLDHLHKVMERLGITTEYEYGESYFIKRGQEITSELVEKGIATESEGAVIVSLDEYDIDTPAMLRKANGTALYATTDLATIEFREKKWNPTRVFIHTGQEQAFYFRQLKALAKKAGYPDTIVHLWHGLVDQIDETGKRGKMSSRKGVIALNDLLDEAERKAAVVTKDGTQEDIHAIALGAIKFADFTADRKKGTLFDWETLFNVQGFSGPAVQYAAVRIGSILQKAGIASYSTDAGYDWKAEHALLLQLTAFPDLITELADNYELHKLAAYLYQLARVFNRYYEQVPILKAPPREQVSRLWLLAFTKQVFETGLDVLGIQVPAKM